jgi:hypothetical protein
MRGGSSRQAKGCRMGLTIRQRGLPSQSEVEEREPIGVYQ